MRFIALLFDWLLYTLLVACMSIGTIAIHAPDVVYRLTSRDVISVEPTNIQEARGIADINWVPVDKATGLEP